MPTKPKVLVEVDNWRLVEWENGRLQLSKRIFNPQSNEWEYRNIPVTMSDLLVIPTVCEKGFIEYYEEHIVKGGEKNEK